MCVCVCVCVVSVIVKRPVLPPSVVDGRSRNPLYYYYFHDHAVLGCGELFVNCLVRASSVEDGRDRSMLL